MSPVLQAKTEQQMPAGLCRSEARGSRAGAITLPVCVRVRVSVCACVVTLCRRVGLERGFVAGALLPVHARSVVSQLCNTLWSWDAWVIAGRAERNSSESHKSNSFYE